ncbi:MAG: hypothetical protein KC636_25475 [Myxococcales bacterium]|nr:hypothetical protein [Myxococcales bacterium]
MTKLNLILLAIVVTGGGTYLALRDDPAPAEERDEPDRRAKRSPAQRTEAAPRSGDLERRVADLEDEVRELRAALRLQRSAVMVGGGGSDDDEDYEPGDAPSPVVAAQVREVLAAEREAESQRRIERRSERMEGRRAEAMEELVAATGIGASTQRAITELWTTEGTQITELFSAGFGGGGGGGGDGGGRSRQDIRQEVQRIRTETDAAAKDLLSDEQFQAYLEHRPGMGRGGPGGRGGRGGEGGRPADGE